MTEWKMVPVAPTEEMLDAAATALNLPSIYVNGNPNGEGLRERQAVAAYAAMLTAAPVWASEAGMNEVCMDDLAKQFLHERDEAREAVKRLAGALESVSCCSVCEKCVDIADIATSAPIVKRIVEDE